ncbi:PspA/IM30 family protein [Nocardia macrotermitis]|uniref:Uncharacterized protein n=1 Tax=Nocardia macrotermitis TaxID=2585198 RepID=A0A7K0D712_9NOCA|nr:hypothetical protein [Nocardia macrotermitis]MQY21132.1 hypothetical protein [Nocardia macrotermitis]
MTDPVEDLAALLAALPDEDVLSVVLAASVGRPGLDRLHLVAAELSAESGHMSWDPDVNSPTDPPTIPGMPAVPTSYDQGPSVPAAPFAPTSVPDIGGYSDSGVPTFESVRDKVERRFGNAQGMGELDQQTPAGRSAQEQWQARSKSARERLDEIRKSLHRNDPG